MFGDNGGIPISENSSLNPYDNYTLYHGNSDVLLEQYAKNSYMDIIILRVSNGFGYPIFNNRNCWNLIINNFCYNAYYKKK